MVGELVVVVGEWGMCLARGWIPECFGAYGWEGRWKKLGVDVWLSAVVDGRLILVIEFFGGWLSGVVHRNLSAVGLVLVQDHLVLVRRLSV